MTTSPAQPRPRTGGRWRRGGLLVVPLAVLAALLLAAPPAQAQDSLSEIEAELDAAWRELEPIIEDYNRVHSELEESLEAAEELEEEMAPLELHATLASEQVGEIASWQYRTGPMSALDALVTSGSPTAFVERLTALDQIARGQRQTLDQASETLETFETRRSELDALIAEQSAQEEELTERREEIEADIEELEDLREEAVAAGSQTAAGGGEVAPSGSCPAVNGSGAGAAAAEFACGEIGKPYEFGATGPGSYDCSGLTQAAWAAAGVSLTHFTGAQWDEGYAVSRDEAQPGDLVFFYSDLSHVGVYVGAGMMVDAPTTGSVVNMRSIDTMPITGFRRPG